MEHESPTRGIELTGCMDVPDLVLNPNLSLEHVSRDESGMCLIQDRATRKLYRIGPTEFEWLSQLAARSTHKLVIACDPHRHDHLLAFLDKAQQVGLLLPPSQLHTLPKSRRLQLRGAMQIQVHLFDPSALSTNYKPLVLLVCSRPAIVLYSVVLIVGILIGATNASRIVNQLTSMPWNLSYLGYGWFALAAISVIHECAHMAAAAFYGVPVRSIGLMLFYLQPSMYAELTAMWSLKDGHKRAIIASVGIYAQCIVSAVLLIMWWATDRLAYSYPYLLTLALLNLSLAVANAVPFVKLDGYWILTSLIGLPNLRLTAMQLVKQPNTNSPYSLPVTILLYAFGVGCYITGTAFVINGVAGAMYILYRIGVPPIYIAALVAIMLTAWLITHLQRKRRGAADGTFVP